MLIDRFEQFRLIIAYEDFEQRLLLIFSNHLILPTKKTRISIWIFYRWMGETWMQTEINKSMSKIRLFVFFRSEGVVTLWELDSHTHTHTHRHVTDSLKWFGWNESCVKVNSMKMVQYRPTIDWTPSVLFGFPALKIESRHKCRPQLYVTSFLVSQCTWVGFACHRSIAISFNIQIKCVKQAIRSNVRSESYLKVFFWVWWNASDEPRVTFLQIMQFLFKGTQTSSIRIQTKK